VSERFVGADGIPRCGWVGAAPEFVRYHDDEWGHPVHDDDPLVEKLSLEAFQSGLSWRTILAKRENFRAAFAGSQCPSRRAPRPRRSRWPCLVT
jgi:DNA-3-methyladenine glycosylase I